MLKEFVAKKILAHFPFDASAEQLKLVDELSVFITSHETHSLFLLKGYAGTGKTFITKGLTEHLTSIGRKFILAAPTGKAAKVIKEKTKNSLAAIQRNMIK